MVASELSHQVGEHCCTFRIWVEACDNKYHVKFVSHNHNMKKQSF